MHKKTQILLALTLAIFVSGDALAQGIVTGKKKSKAPTSVKKTSKATATKVAKTPKAVTAHNKYVKPLIKEWSKKTDSPIRDYEGGKVKGKIPPCTIAFWIDSEKDYWVVPLGKVTLLDRPNTNTTESSQYDAYSQTPVFKCKGGSQCIYRFDNPNKKRSEFSTGFSITRLKYHNTGKNTYNGFPNMQSYYNFFNYGHQAVPACQGKKVPAKYNGSPG